MLQPAYQLGPFIIKVSLVIIVLSLIVSYFVTKYRLKNVSTSKEIIESLSNAFIISIIVWKLSYIIIHPIRTLENPFVLLFFDGGSIGTILAVLSFICILLYYARKQDIAVTSYIDAALTGIISFYLLNYFLKGLIYVEDRIVHIIGVLIALVFIILIMKVSFPLKNKTLLEFILWWSIAQVLLEKFMKTSLPFVGPFSTQQVIYITVSVVVIILQLVMRRRNL